MLKEDCWLGKEVWCSLGNALCSGLGHGLSFWGVMDSCAEHSAGEEFRVMDPASEEQPEAPCAGVVLPQGCCPDPLSLLCLVAAAF